MPDGLRKATYVVLFLLLSTFAHAPLARAGFLGEDLRALRDDATRTTPGGIDALWRGPDGTQRPLATLSLALSRRLWSDGGRWSGAEGPALRLENLVWLWLCAAGLGLAVRRALLPWAGSSAADAAGAASALLLACHPLAVPAVAHPGTRGDLIALALSSIAVALFLCARQDRKPPLLAAALALAMLAGFAAPLAWLLPPIAAGLELASARRYRPLHVRLRTAATTLAVFAVAVAVEGVAAALAGARSLEEGGALALFFEPTATVDAAARLQHVVEQLGLLVLPLPAATAGAASFVVAGALALLALQPALVAARSAPRLWGWILFSFAGALGCALLLRSHVRVTQSEFSDADLLLAGTSIASAGLAIGATAVSDVRRRTIPLVIALGYAVLAHASARAWPDAARELATLRVDLALARELHGRDATFVVIDPPGEIAGLDILDDALGLVFDPAFADPGPDGIPDAVLGLSRAGFPAFTREPDFDRRRAQRLVLLPPPASAGARRTALLLAGPEPSTGPTFWRAENRSPLLDLDPFEKRALRVSLLPTVSTGEVPAAAWRARDIENGACDGAWIEGEEGPIALFDLGSSFDWSIGRRIVRLRIRCESDEIVSAEVLDLLPRIELESTEARASGWRFRLAPGATTARVIHGEGRYVLGLLETGRYLYKEFEPESAGADELFFPGTQAFVPSRQGVSAARPATSWSLEYRVGNVAIARATGRIADG